MIQGRSSSNSKASSTFVTLVEGFQQFDNDLNKLQVCVVQRGDLFLRLTLLLSAIRGGQRDCYLEDSEEGESG